MKPFNLAFACLIALTCPDMSRASDGAAGPDQAICATSAVLAADPLAAGESGSWSVLSGAAVFADQHSPITQVTGLAPGENVLQWTLIGDGPPEIDQLVITVYDPAATVAFAGPDSLLCLPSDTMHLLATPAVPPAIGSWASVGIALIDVVTDPHSSVEFPAGGSVQMIWTVFNGTCGQASDTAIISVQECVIGVDERFASTCAMISFDAPSRILTLKNASAGERLDIIDQAGRLLMSDAAIAPVEARIPLSGLLAGTYVVRITGGSKAQVARIVIDR